MVNLNYDFIEDPDGPKGISINSWFERKNMALILVDVQNCITRKKYSNKWSSGGNEIYYYNRIDQIIIPNMQRLIKKFRELKIKIIYFRNASMDQNLSDISRLGIKWTLDELKDIDAVKNIFYYAKDGSFIDERVKPSKEDIVLIKNSSGGFSSTNMEKIMRYNNITRLIFTGGMTDCCLSSTFREACDRGYLCTVIEDACFTSSHKDHTVAIKNLGKYFGWVTKTNNIIGYLDKVNKF